jgi:hypothetical protein
LNEVLTPPRTPVRAEKAHGPRSAAIRSVDPSGRFESARELVDALLHDDLLDHLEKEEGTPRAALETS